MSDETQGRKLCRNCSCSKVNRPRGLCWRCFYTPGVKERFPVTSKYANRGEPTAHELLVVLHQQAKCLPDWWWTEVEDQ